MVSRKWMTVSLAVVFAASVVSLAGADDDAKEKQRNRDKQRQNAGKLDEKTTGANVRSTQLLGRNIENPEGKSVGEISDLVIDTQRGNIRYAAVTYGGLLGIGNKMFAVPFAAFESRQDPDDQDEYILVLDVTQQQLEGDRGFDEDHWPNFADPKFTANIDRRYKVRQQRDETRTDRRDARDKKVAAATIRASELHGLNIQNREGKSVGEIQDLVVNANDGRVKYVAVTYGGFLGLGDKMFAVPFEAFDCRPNPDDEDEYIVVLNVSQKQLEGAEGFDEDHWPNFADRQFTEGLYKRYNVKPRENERRRDRNAADVDVEVETR